MGVTVGRIVLFQSFRLPEAAALVIDAADDGVGLQVFHRDGSVAHVMGVRHWQASPEDVAASAKAWLDWDAHCDAARAAGRTIEGASPATPQQSWRWPVAPSADVGAADRALKAIDKATTIAQELKRDFGSDALAVETPAQRERRMASAYAVGIEHYARGGERSALDQVTLAPDEIAESQRAWDLAAEAAVNSPTSQLTGTDGAAGPDGQ